MEGFNIIIGYYGLLKAHMYDLFTKMSLFQVSSILFYMYIWCVFPVVLRRVAVAVTWIDRRLLTVVTGYHGYHQVVLVLYLVNQLHRTHQCHLYHHQIQGSSWKRWTEGSMLEMPRVLYPSSQSKCNTHMFYVYSEILISETIVSV